MPKQYWMSCVNVEGGLPLEWLYRQPFNPQWYLPAYGRLYSNQGP
jgi:hypothetical protein